MEEGSDELLEVSNIVPLPSVVHKGEMSPIPVIVNAGKSQDFRCSQTRRSMGVSSAPSRSSPAAAVNGNPKCHAGFRMTATDTTYSFLRSVSVQS